jgi:ribonuclease-3
MPLAALQDRLGHRFRNADLLTEALTHASYLPDNPGAGAHNQRLEFLGDSVLHLLLAEALFREFPGERGGG